MSNTRHKKEERRFQEERRDVMTMNKMFAGLIAFVAGVALSAGSAFATKGYMTGDSAMMKLVPYFETGENRATLIAIQNMSMQEQDTMNRNALVSGLKAYLAGSGNANAAIITATTAANGGTAFDGIADGAPIDKDNLNEVAVVEKALATAEMNAYTEHVFVTVNVYDAKGMMMEGASTNLCLAENQGGYVILQGPAMQDWQMEIPNQGMILSVMDGDIPEYGYVQIMAGGTKYQACSSATPAGIMRVDTRSAANITANNAVSYTGAMSEVAAWAIVQDTGMGFFGTEVPTSTITMMMDDEATDADESKMTNCYNPDGETETPDLTDNEFNTMKCGLIPERHNMAMADDDNDATTLAPYTTATTPRGSAFARYDTDGEASTVYVWLAEGMDTDDTLPKDRRMLEVVVTCMDGTMPPGPDRNGDNQPDPIMVAAPEMITMIDPADMDGLGMYTDMCDDGRGLLEIMMPRGSKAGMVFTHLTQAGNSYRMNFPGYSMASPTTCASATGVPAQRAACM